MQRLAVKNETGAVTYLEVLCRGRHRKRVLERQLRMAQKMESGCRSPVALPTTS